MYELTDERGRPLPGEVAPQAPQPQVVVVFGSGQVDSSRIKPGNLVWRNKDGALEARLRATYDGLAASAVRRVPVTVRVTGAVGLPLTITLKDEQGREACASSSLPLAPASSRPLSVSDIEKAVGVVLDAGGTAGSTVGSMAGGTSGTGTLALCGAVDVSGLELGKGVIILTGQ